MTLLRTMRLIGKFATRPATKCIKHFHNGNYIKNINTLVSYTFNRQIIYRNNYDFKGMRLTHRAISSWQQNSEWYIKNHKSFSSLTSIRYDKLENQKTSLADELLASKVNINETKADNEKGAKSEEDKEKTLRTIKFTFYAFGVIITSLGGFLIYSWGSPQVDAAGNPIKDEYSELPVFKQYLYRTLHEAKNMNKMIQEPSRDKLLPDPLSEPYIQPLYTLVLEMKDVLVHPEWTYETGWRFKKRPGVDFLLQHCGPPLFEIVIYTNEQAFTAFPVIEQLDPNGFIWYKLFKDSTRYTNGKHLKDLNCLNRDLNKVIVVDWDSGAITSPRNQLTLPRWNGSMKDQALVELAMMLRTIAESQVSDVREVLDYYRSFSDPIEAFKENQRVAQAHEEELQKAVKESSFQKGLTSSWSSTFLKRK